jgi:hypothetical protein
MGNIYENKIGVKNTYHLSKKHVKMISEISSQIHRFCLGDSNEKGGGNSYPPMCPYHFLIGTNSMR